MSKQSLTFKFVISFYIGSFVASMIFQPLVYGVAANSIGSPDNECKNAGFNFGIAKYNVGSNSPENGSQAINYILNVSWSEAGSVSWTANPAVAGVLSKEGTSSYINDGGTSGTIVKHGQNGFSHITFCGNVPEPTPTPVPTPESRCILEITKQVDTTDALSGEIINYEINFKNIGNIDCTGGGVKVADSVNVYLVFISATQSSNVTPGYSSTLYNSTNRLLTWNANVLNPGESGWVKWTAKVKLPSDICGVVNIPNVAKISADELNWQWVYSNEVVTVASRVCATPTPTPTVTVTVTPIPTLTPTPSESTTPTPIPEVSPTPTPIPTPTLIPTPIPTPTPDPTLTPTPTPECEQGCTESTPTPTPTPSDTPTPTPSATPLATPTPTTTSTGGGGGGGGGCYGCEPYKPPTPTPTPISSFIPTPSATPIPTITPEVLGAIDQPILPETGFFFIDRILISVLSAAFITGMMMMFIGFDLVPQAVIGHKEEN